MNHLNIEINKQIELVQVLLYLSERQNKTYQHINNATYFTAIQSFFHKFKNHNAVKLTTELIDKNNFIHIKPIKAILNINDIITNINHPFYQWSIAVKEFEKDSNFDGFSQMNHAYYTTIVAIAKSYDVIGWVEYTENFFRKKFNLFNLILSPSNGNYGFILDTPEKETAYMVDAAPYYNNNGKLIFWEEADKQYYWGEVYLSKGLAHEFGHCFVNPIVERYKTKLNALSSFFQSHKTMLNAYNVDYAVMNEYFVRAYSIKFMKKFEHIFKNFDIDADIERHKKVFIHINEFIKLLDEYERENISFEDFYLSKLENISMFGT